MKNIVSFKEHSSIDYSLYAWLYFIYNNNVFKLKGWIDDYRMNRKHPCQHYIEILKNKGIIFINSENIVEIIDKKATLKELNKVFKSSTLNEAINTTYELYDLLGENFSQYKIHTIPVDFFILKNPTIEKAFNKIDDLCVDYHNQGRNVFAQKIFENRYLSEYNKYTLHKYYFPNKIPLTAPIYRGIKNDYDASKDTNFISYTLDKEQAERFYTYHFSKGFTANPSIAKKQTLLISEVNFTTDKYVAILVGDEDEVLMYEAPKNVKVEKVK